MASYSTNELKSGLKVLSDGDPHEILKNEYVKPGKGQAFNRLKMRNLLSGRVIDKTLKSGDSLEAADIKEFEVNYLYNDGNQWHFMNNSSYEQYAVDGESVGDGKHWLREQDVCTMRLYNGEVIAIAPPNFVELKVTEAEANVKGDTATGGDKSATLETGITIRVPLFIEPGETIKVDTRTGTYVGRAK